MNEQLKSILNKIIEIYKTDNFQYGSMYITPDGTLLYIENGHSEISDYLFTLGLEKNYKAGTASQILKEQGYIRLNTKIGYIDLTDITPTTSQLKRLREIPETYKIFEIKTS